MKMYPLRRYVPGTYKRECDICGFDGLRSDMIKDQDDFIVCPPCFTDVDNRRRTRHKKHIVVNERPFKRD